jgi:biotin synthase
MHSDTWLKKSADGSPLSRDEIIALLDLPSDCSQSYAVMAEARRVSRSLTGDHAEIHAQFALNLAPCGCGCLFCSFAAVNGIFTQSTQLTVEQAVAHALQFEHDGANAIFVMSTAHFPFEQYIETAQAIRHALKPRTRMIANVGDQNDAAARALSESGFCGVYHALRLREGIDTKIDPRKRMASIKSFQDAGLKVGTCVEPIGPEHTNQELADAILLTAAFNPSYSGAARRIAIPGTAIATRGMITELRMAQIVAVTRLAMPRSVPGNCTHEPCTLGALAGANLFWAEVGANPRDVRAKTEEGRGHTVAQCKKIFEECDCGVHEGSSVFYS